MIKICSYHIHFQKQFQELNFSLVFSIKHFVHNLYEHNFFHYHFRKIIIEIPTSFPTIVSVDFNINMSTKTIKSIRLQTYMNAHNFHITSTKRKTPNKTQIDHI
jgi:hypothetical protein